MMIRTRFAPSPTGELHLGNARTALFSWLYARANGGQFVLRVEDTDAERSRPEYETALIADLQWLGLDWDEGPDCGGPHAPYRQTGRIARYEVVAQQLLASRDAYWCFCGKESLDTLRAEYEARGEVYHYPGYCRKLDPAESAQRKSSGESAALRLASPQEMVAFTDLIRGPIETPPEQIADFVLVRNDGMPVYNFAVVADDHDMEITHVLRGEDHISNTPKQILIYRALGWTIPHFAHLPMLLGPDRSKLSKRHGDTTLADLRVKGFPPAAVINALALCGWSHPGGLEIFTPEEARKAFSLERVNRAAAVFDETRLRFLSGQHLRAHPAAELAGIFAEEIVAAGLAPQHEAVTANYHDALFAVLRANLETRNDFAPAAAALLPPTPLPEAGEEETAALPALRALHASLAELPGAITIENWKAAGKAAMTTGGVKGKGFYHPLRVALTGRPSGPELDKLIPLLEIGDSAGVAAFAGGARARLSRALAAWDG